MESTLGDVIVNNDAIRDAIQQFVEEFLNAGFIAICVIIAGLWIKSISSTIFMYLRARFSDIGVGLIVELHKEKFRVDEIRFTYIILRSVERRGVVLRYPVAKWDDALKYIHFCRNEDDQGSEPSSS